MESDLIALSLPASLASWRRLSKVLKEFDLENKPINLLSVNTLINDFEGRVKDELKSTYFLSLNVSEQELFSHQFPLFADDMRGKFDSVIYEIEQGAKCMALGLATAASFHFIRCLEAAIRAMCRCLGMPDPTKASDRNWSNILRDINCKIDEKFGPKNTRLTGDGAFFDKVIGALTAMNNPYRNPTMHLDAKYGDHEARHIQELVAGIMRLIASRMDENGVPKV